MMESFVCPGCGEYPNIWFGANYTYRLFCRKCKLLTCYHDDIDEAVREWNGVVLQRSKSNELE